MSEIKRLSLSGPAGLIEAQLTLPDDSTKGTGPIGAAVLCHPHPQYGGTMDDAVLETADSQLTKQNVVVLRFNFRGVGASEGSYGNGEGEAQDVLAALGWMSQKFPDLPHLLAGYSFGAAAAWRAVTEPQPAASTAAPDALWLIAPPVGMMGEPTGAPSLPVTIFHPDQDDFTTPQVLNTWTAELAEPQPTVHWITGANHFFHGAGQPLATAIAAAAPAVFPAAGSS